MFSDKIFDLFYLSRRYNFPLCRKYIYNKKGLYLSSTLSYSGRSTIPSEFLNDIFDAEYVNKKVNMKRESLKKKDENKVSVK